MQAYKTVVKILKYITKVISPVQWLTPLISFSLAIIFRTFAIYHPTETEIYYSRTVYPYIGQSLSLINGFTWTSLSEILIGSLVAVCVFSISWQTKKIYKKETLKRTLLIKNIWYVTNIISLGLLLFILLWGLNYQKQPLLKNLGLEERKTNATELTNICRFFITLTNQNYKEAIEQKPPLTNNNIEKSQLNVNWKELNDLIEEGFQKENLLKNISSGSYSPAKAVYFSKLMSNFGISGFFMPFTGEPNVNVAQPDVSIPFTLAHEKAHQRGFALEDEANFLAFLVCTKSKNSYCRYSGYLMASRYLLNNLPYDQYKEIYQTFDSGPKNDLKAINKFWAQYDGKISTISSDINNTYLKANRIKSGIANYSQVVDLIVSYHFIYNVDSYKNSKSSNTQEKQN